MASNSNVPALQFTNTGLVVPAESDIVNGVLADINAAFGGGLNTSSLETPQGQLASSIAAIVADKNAEIAYLTNAVDPQYADGRFQDAIARIYFLSRLPATATVVTCTVTGLPGTVIPAGALAQDTNGNQYASTGAVTIGASGNATAQFQCLTTGPIPCPAGTLTNIVQVIPGWDSITNPTDGVMGQNEESRTDFEIRRQNSVAANSAGGTGAIYAAVASVTGVLDAYVIDNPTNTAQTYGATNYSIPPHCVYVAAVGGTDADIAKAIWSKKAVGCDTTGNTSVQVQDTNGYSYPPPTYTIKFNRPTALPVYFTVTLVNNASVPSNIVSLVQNAIIARFNGTDGTTRERIGGTILASRYYSAVAGVADNLQILSITVGSSANPTTISLTLGIDQYPSISAANIQVVLQ